MYSPHFFLLHFTIHVKAIAYAKRLEKSIYALGFEKKMAKKGAQREKSRPASSPLTHETQPRTVWLARTLFLSLNTRAKKYLSHSSLPNYSHFLPPLASLTFAIAKII